MRSLAKQRAEKQQKKVLLHENSMIKSSEVFIDMYYHDMYGSAACWKTVATVNREPRKLTSNKSKIDVLKINIRMRVLGLGWSDIATPWSRNGKLLTVSDLSDHLKLIIVQQIRRTIPDKPLVFLPERKLLPNIGAKI